MQQLRSALGQAGKGNTVPRNRMARWINNSNSKVEFHQGHLLAMQHLLDMECLLASRSLTTLAKRPQKQAVPRWPSQRPSSNNSLARPRIVPRQLFRSPRLYPKSVPHKMVPTLKSHSFPKYLELIQITIIAICNLGLAYPRG
jgi:hypothetical protein